jgi:hypothetical protein
MIWTPVHSRNLGCREEEEDCSDWERFKRSHYNYGSSNELVGNSPVENVLARCSR